MIFSARNLALMGVLVAFNVVLGGAVHILKLPIYLDAIGTILAALLLGWRAGVIVGVLSFLLAAAVINPVYIWFCGTQAVIAIYVALVANWLRGFASTWRAALSGIGLGVVTGIVSAPVIVLVFGGVAGSGRDLLTATLIGTGEQVFKAVILSGAASEPFDKLLQVLAAYLIIRSLPKRVIGQFRNSALEKNGLV